MSEFNREGREAIRTWTVDRVAMVIDTSHERWLNRLRDAACRGIAEGMGSPAPKLDDYRRMQAGLSAPFERYEYADVVGVYVRDELLELIEEENAGRESVALMLLVELLDLHDSSQARMFGDHYMPEDADDLADYFDEVDEDEDEDEGESE